MLSVSAEAAAYSQQAFVRTKGTPDRATGFSALVDSNTDASTASRDAGAPQTGDQPATARGDDASSTDTAGTQPTRSETKTAAKGDSNGKTDTTRDSNTQQQSTDVSASAGATTADASAVADQMVKTNAAAQGAANQGKGKTTTKSNAAGDNSTTDAAQSVPTDQATTLVVAVVAGIVPPNPTAPVTPNATPGQTAVAATTAVSSAPGAIAAAAANKAAADVAATQPAATAQLEVVQSTDAKPAATDQAPGIAAAQQSADLTATTEPAAAAVAPDEAAALAQAVATAQTRAPVKTDGATASSAKAAKTATVATDAKAATDKTEPTVLDPQTTKAADPIAPKKSANTLQTHDTPDQPATKAQTDADTAAVPMVHQHVTVETRIAQPSALGTTDLANATQAAAANAAAATTPAPAATAALNTANLTVLTGQAVPLSGLAVEISANAKAGNSRFEIRLDPPDLGRIDVRLDVDKNGQVTSRLFVEKSETLDLLRRDAPQLQQALQDAGLKTSDSGLQFSLRDQNPQQGQNNNSNGQNPQRLVIAEDDTAAASAAGLSYGRSLGASGGVDIRV